MEDVFDVRLSHCIHIPSGDKHELRVTKKPAGAEQFAFQPQAALRRGRDDSQPRRQKRDDPVGFFIPGLFQDKARGHNGIHLFFLLPGR